MSLADQDLTASSSRSFNSGSARSSTSTFVGQSPVARQAFVDGVVDSDNLALEQDLPAWRRPLVRWPIP